MRIVRRGAATAIDVSDDGSGFSRGTGTSIHVTDKIEIALAGPLPKRGLARYQRPQYS